MQNYPPNSKPQMINTSAEEMVGDLINLANTILSASQAREETMNKLVTTTAVIDTRLKSVEKIIWPLVLAGLTGLIGSVIALISK